MDHAVLHAEWDEAAASVAPQAAEHNAPEPGLGAVAPGAVDSGGDQAAAVGAVQGHRILA